ncbi:MAG: DUF2071 domain-containing protein [Luteitalea sp.]|nr:DUF2071 domain-containing protein [Luteitalea sp.]
MPTGPWIMTQTWHDLLFAHWPVEPPLLAALIPPSLELDLFDGRAWLGIVPFHMTNVAPRGVPALPWMSAFPELNVRTYVRVGAKAGVYFFSLDAGNSVAVRVARTMFHLPYHSASMQVEQRGDGIHYVSRRNSDKAPAAELVATYRPTGPVFHPREGSLEYFLTERYCLYTVNKKGDMFTVEIHHPAWPLQVADAEIAANSMAESAGIQPTTASPLLHFAKRQDMVNWGRTRIAAR